MSSDPRSEHPRPAFRRRDWLCLHGPWEFGFDDSGSAPSADWHAKLDFGSSIVVPFAYQSPLSGIGDRSVHPVLWYRRRFDLPPTWRGPRTLLHFGAVDYRAEFWLNGSYLGMHEGGYTPVDFDVTRAVRPNDNVLVVRAEDLPSGEQPCGKQDRESHQPYCFAATSGIWQSVWIEPVGDAYLTDCRMTPDAAGPTLRLSPRAAGVGSGLICEARVAVEGQIVGVMAVPLDAPFAEMSLFERLLWSPDNPQAYEVLLRLFGRSGEPLDEVYSYFGMRDLRIEGSQIILNDEPFYQRQVLDQGYWPDGIYTAPTDEALRADVEWIKRLGFNGVRKHQKVEDPRWLYWCDRLGLAVWEEMPAFATDTPLSRERFRREWQEVIRRDANHPCIVAWAPFNESFGIHDVSTNPSTQAFVSAIVDDTRRLDPGRPVVDNSGWDHVDTDIADTHNYEPSGRIFRAAWRKFQADPAGVNTLRSWNGEHQGRQWYGPQYYHPLFVPGRSYGGEPVVVSEWGGFFLEGSGDVAPIIGQRRGVEPDEEAFLKRYADMIRAFDATDGLAGDCWTQLTDIEDEPNGLLTEDRKPKVDPDRVRKINTARRRRRRPRGAAQQEGSNG